MANIQIKDLPAVTSLEPNDIIHVNLASTSGDRSIIFSNFVSEIIADYKANNTDVVNEVDTKIMTPQRTAYMLDTKKSTQAQAEAGTDNTTLMTPLRVFQAINNKVATTEQRGSVELATSAETITGTDTQRAITPSGLSARTGTESRDGIVRYANQAQAEAALSSSLAMSPLRTGQLIIARTPDIADKNYRDLLSGGGNLSIHQQYHLSGDSTFILPNISGISKGSTIVLTKEIDNTPTIRVFNTTSDRIRVGRYSGDVILDTSVIFDINCEILLIFNGTYWEV